MCPRTYFSFVSCAVAVLILSARAQSQDPPVFEEPERVFPLTVDGGTILRGSTTADGLTLYYHVWFWLGEGNGNNNWVYRATRASVDLPFEGGVKLGPPVNLSGVWSAYAWVSPDHQYLYFISGNNRQQGLGGADVWVATKTDVEGDFDQVHHLGAPVSSGVADRFGCISADGTQAFVTHQGKLVVAEFNVPHDPLAGFAGSRELAEINGVWEMPPTVSPDGLQIFWSDSPPGWWSFAPRAGGQGGADLWMATRLSTDLDALFEFPVNLGRPANSGTDELCPVVSPDGERLIFSRMSGGLWQAEIACLERAGVDPSWSMTPENPVVGEEVTFDASVSGDGIVSYEWVFGDGSSAEGERVQHHYETPGRHEVRLTVRNAEGLCDRRIELLTVHLAPNEVTGWTSTDVGEPTFPGSAHLENDCLVVCAGGGNLSVSDEEYHFVYQEVAGDFALEARVQDVQRGTSVAQVGPMLRDTLEPGGRFAMTTFQVSSIPRVRFLRRETAGDGIDRTTGTRPELPVWLRLERRGDLVVGWSSTDEEGLTWTEIDRTEFEALPRTVFIGIAASGNDSRPLEPYSPLEATLCDLRVITPDPVSFRRGDANTDGAVDISDATFLLEHLFATGESLECRDSGDSNDDGRLDISDAITTLLHLFGGGVPIPAPGAEECGVDSTPEEPELGCQSYPPCG